MLPNEATRALSTARNEPKITESLNDEFPICGANRVTMPTMSSNAPNMTFDPAWIPKKSRALTMFIQTIVDNAIAVSAEVM